MEIGKCENMEIGKLLKFGKISLDCRRIGLSGLGKMTTFGKSELDHVGLARKYISIVEKNTDVASQIASQDANATDMLNSGTMFSLNTIEMSRVTIQTCQNLTLIQEWVWKD